MRDEQIPHAQATAIVAAARRYRDTVRRYLAEQVAGIDRGATLDELVTRETASFRETMRAEEELFALLDALEVQ